MTPSDGETHVVLLLDLAEEHPIDENLVLARVPNGAATKVLRLSEHGAPRSATGTPEDWGPVIPAIAALAAAAFEVKQGGRRCRYWIAGRAGLPAFVHLGYLLSSRAAVTLVNERKTGEVDVLALGTRGASSPPSGGVPYFHRSAPPAEKDRSEGPVGLVVSSGIEVPADQARSAMAARGVSVAAILEAQADRYLDDAELASAVGQIDQMIAEVVRWYPDTRSLAIFVAGPATLAFLVGRAIAANVFPDIQVFEYRDRRYQLAYETVPKHVILFLASNPRDTSALELQREADEIRKELDCSGRGDRFEIVPLWAAEQMDLLRELRRLRPSVLHFAGHGAPGGLYFHAADGSAGAMSPEVFMEVLDAVGVPVSLVVLNACDSDRQAAALCPRVQAAVGMAGKISDAAARSFAVGFYGGLGAGEPLSAAFRQGCVAISLCDNTTGGPSERDIISQGHAQRGPDPDRPQLTVRDGIDPSTWVLVRRPRR